MQPELAAIVRQDFVAFIQKVFTTVAPGDTYIHNWHIEAIAYQMTRCRSGEISRLIINQPPRSLKSIVASIAYPAWLIGHDPSTKIICVSYGSELANSLHRLFRMVMDAPWYKALFPLVQVQRDTGSELTTTRNGGRIATSIGGTLTGRGADVIVIDDPLKAEEASSETSRNSVIEWYSSTLASRLDDKNTGVIIVVMQRLHEDDLSGQLLQKDGWEHLNLPAIAQDRQEISLSAVRKHIRQPGDLLQPLREPKEVLDRLSADLGSFGFSAQYQQQPVPFEGNLIKRQWFGTYTEPPRQEGYQQIVQSWDVATSAKNTANYSVCTTWLKRHKSYYLLHVLRIRAEFPTVKNRVITMAQEWHANVILIEKEGIGVPLLQQLLDEQTPGIPVPIGIKVVGDKLQRMQAQAARIEAGQVYLPAEAGWLPDFLNEIFAFPNGRNDDQVDSISQFLHWASKNDANLSTVAFPIIFNDDDCDLPLVEKTDWTLGGIIR